MSASPDPPLARIGLATTTSRLAVLLVVLFVAGASVSIDAASALLLGAKDWVVDYFDWLFVGVANAAILIVVVLALLPRTNVRLGADESRPEFGNLAWFAMLLSAGLASGLLYWAAAEPILHQQENPFLGAEAGDPRAAAERTALRITVFHWGIHGWALYVLAGLSIAYYSYRRGGPLGFRTAFLPVLGKERIDRWPGLTIDLLAAFGTVCGVATSIGLSAGGINATLGSLLGFDVTIAHQVAIVFAVCGLGIVSAISGLENGVRRLSELNVWVSGLLLLAFVTLGPTWYLAQLFVRTVVDYVVMVLPTGIWLAGNAEDRAWQGAWTVFYWAWWLAWTPFVSLFIARISKGRTVREFVFGVMLAPTSMILVWMTVLGGTALHQEAASPGLVSGPVAQDYSHGVVTVTQNLAGPLVATALLSIVAFLLFTWLITSLDSATLVLCQLLGSDEGSPAKLFWGLALAAVTVVLLNAGGISALQAASITIGLPLAALMVLMGAGLVWDLATSGAPGRTRSR